MAPLRITALALLLLGSGAMAEETGSGGTITSYGISTFGDLKYPSDFKHFDYADPDAAQGGTMVFRGTGASQTFDSLNPFILKGEPAQGLGLLYDSLLTGSLDEPDSAYGLVASALEYPPDRSWVTFTMRPEATFSDGQPITAEDVVFTVDVLREKGSPTYQMVLKDIAKVEALDPTHVKFTFREDAPKRDLPGLAGGLSILPKHYYDTVDFAESTIVPPVGSGQFVVAAVDPGKSIKYCRTPTTGQKIFRRSSARRTSTASPISTTATTMRPSKPSRSAMSCSSRNFLLPSGPPATTFRPWTRGG